MAECVDQALADGGVFIAESGTGTGKTIAYSVPALLSGKKLIISTGTKHLQDQLFRRDLPLVRAALDIPVSIALLKGRANYLCLYRLHNDVPQWPDGQADTRLDHERVRTWAQRTRDGDITSLSEVTEDSAVWPAVTSTVDNCLGSSCSYYDDCYVNRARRHAANADVLVINHHLFCADLVLREDGFGQLLPGVEAVIFDEAHQLPRTLSRFLGTALTSYQITELCRDSVRENAGAKAGVADLVSAADRLQKSVADLRLTLGRDPQRGTWAELEANPEVMAGTNAMQSALAILTAVLEVAAPASEGLDRCWRRSQDLEERLEYLVERDSEDTVRWFETTTQSFRFQATPLDIGSVFLQQVAAGDKAWIFTSATLAVAGRFDHFQNLMGLETADTRLWDSPFDFAQQALLYLPPDMPDPRTAAFTQCVVERALPVIESSRGRAFMLFTSYRALHEAERLLRPHIAFPILVQGSAPRTELLNAFRDSGNAVLLGTSSLWEGVDVPGDALSCVIIDKLPFAPPDDPVLRARLAALERAGRNPFLEFQLPNAVIALKQGAGRLIRGAADRGVLMVCDPRLKTKSYGKVFLESLPPMPQTQDLERVTAFLAGVTAPE